MQRLFSRISLKAARIGAACIIAVVFIAIYFFNQQASKHYEQSESLRPYGGTLVIGTYNSPTIINPILTSHSISAALMELIFNSLVRVNHEGQLIPGLAQSWDVSDDGMEYVFYIEKGVHFHDGKELTANDIKFTYDMIADPKNQSHWRTNIEMVDRFEVIDPYQLKMYLNKPFPLILEKLTREIAPKHLLKGQDLTSTVFNYEPVGTGPFKFKSWDKETDEIELMVNKDYFEGRAYLDKIVVKSYADSRYLWSAFLRGEVDLVNFISREDYELIKDNVDFQTHEINLDKYFAIFYNLEDSILKNSQVRKAIAHSINKKQIMKTVSNAGIESTGPFHPEAFGFNPDVAAFTYAPDYAKTIFEQEGWVLDSNNEEGVRFKDGRALELRLLVNDNYGEYALMAKIIRQNLSEVGMKTTIQLYNDSNDLSEFIEKNRPQAWIRFFGGPKAEGYESASDWYSSSSKYGTVWAYDNKEVDRLFQLVRVTQDREKRAEIYKKIHQIVYDDQPAYFLYFPSMFHAVSAEFKNTHAFFSLSMPGYTLKDWYLLP